MTRERTAGPWVVAPGTVRGSVTVRADTQKDGDFRKPVAEVWHNGDDHEANAALIAAAPDLYHELYMQVRNCPVCKGDGFAVDVFDMLTQKPPHEKKPCTRCASSRAALSRAESTALSGQT